MVNIELRERQSLSIGREADNDVVLPDQTVSRYHAMLRAVGGHYYLCDRGSTNGTYLDGQRIRDAEVRAGDVARLGEVGVRFTQDRMVLRGRARCSRTDQTFGIRYTRGEDAWVAAGTFELNERRAASPLFEDEAVKVVGFANYPGCPECGASGIVRCGCGEVSCSEYRARKHTCPWCGSRGRPEKPRDITVAGALDQG
jgi:hypothetical protein